MLNEERNNPYSGKPTGILGIDAGGTFTDLAFMSGSELRLIAKAKTQTNHDDLIATIRNGIDLISKEIDASQIRSVNIATTLATNAIVENKLRPVALILIGYAEDIVERAVRNGTFSAKYVVRINGGHDADGNELAPLDTTELSNAVDSIVGHVEAVAVSGFFSVRNTDHELRALRFIEEKLPGVHVTCGHELASELDAIKRATTTALNAGLIPIVMDLLASVERVCRERGINSPITIVRGDGSLVGAEWAKSHPVEMILSGPAGSACGGRFLAGEKTAGRESWVVDIGGTTTDIIHLDKAGRPILLQEGATVGGHKTLVKAIDIYTFGLGGDSRVQYDRERRIKLGPRRVRPLCSAAIEFPEIVEMLKLKLAIGYCGEPLIIVRGVGTPSTEFEKRIIDKLEGGPKSMDALLDGERMANLGRTELERMETLGLVNFASFTPTDALHVIGHLNIWNKEASILGAKVMLYDKDDEMPETVAKEVCRAAVRKIASNIFRKSMSYGGLDLFKNEEILKLIELSFGEESKERAQLSLKLNAALIGAGAPTWAFIGGVGDQLNENALLPADADVAGAVGAAVGTFSLHYAVRIIPHGDGTFRAHHPLGVTDYDDLETAVADTCKFMEPWVVDRARRAGARLPVVSLERTDEEAWISGGTRRVFLWTQLAFTVLDEKDEKRG